MPRSSLPHPTRAELEILEVLRSSSVGQVLESLPGKGARAYTSVMTVMTIMTRKRYLTRRKVHVRGYVYTSDITEQSPGRSMPQDLIDRVSHGSCAFAMLHMLDGRELDSEELQTLREFLTARQVRSHERDPNSGW